MGLLGLGRNTNGERDGAQPHSKPPRLRSPQRGFEGAFFMPEQRLLQHSEADERGHASEQL